MVLPIIVLEGIVNAGLIIFITLFFGYFFRFNMYHLLLSKTMIRLGIALLISMMFIAPYFAGLYPFLYVSVILIGIVTIYVHYDVTLVITFLYVISKFIFHINFTIVDIYFILLIIINLIVNITKIRKRHQMYITSLSCLLFINIELALLQYDIFEILLMNIVAVLTLLCILFVIGLIDAYNNLYLNTLKDAFVDQESQLYNRSYFKKRYINKIMNDSLAIFDIDLFNNFEILYGHVITNQIIIQFSEILRKNLSQIGEIYRTNSNKFYVVIKSKDQVKVISCIKRLKLEVENTNVVYEDSTVNFTVSIGVKFCTSQITAFDLIEEATKALMESKVLGRNKLTVVY